MPLPLAVAVVLILHPPTRAPDYCLRQSEAALNGVHLAMPHDSVVGLLGEPGSRTTRRGEDDGGAYETLILAYPGLQVEVGREERVERMVATGRGARMPTGVRVGQRLEEVLRRLGAPESEELEEVTWSPPLCEDGPLDPVSVTIAFSWTPVQGPFETGRPLNQVTRLVQIELARQGP